MIQIDVAVSIGGATERFDLKALKPMNVVIVMPFILLIVNALCVVETTNVRKALSPNLAIIKRNITLREVAVKLGLVIPAQFDKWVRPEQMV